jgi:hypothetical protein
MRTFRTQFMQNHRLSGSLCGRSLLKSSPPPEPGGRGYWQEGAEIRLAPPPGTAETAAEIASLKAYIAGTQASPERLKRVRYWNSGSRTYRWVEIALNQIQDQGLSNPRNARAWR